MRLSGPQLIMLLEYHVGPAIVPNVDAILGSSCSTTLMDQTVLLDAKLIRVGADSRMACTARGEQLCAQIKGTAFEFLSNQDL